MRVALASEAALFQGGYDLAVVSFVMALGSLIGAIMLMKLRDSGKA